MKDTTKLQKLTDDFLTTFFKEAAKLETGSTGKSKSYNFGYTFVDMLVNSKYVQKEYNHREDSPLIGMGFVDNIAKNFFNKSIQGVSKDIQFLIDNFDAQESYYDWYAKDLIKKEETYTDPLSINSKWRGTSNSDNGEPMFIPKEKTRIIYRFSIHNNKSGKSVNVEVISKKEYTRKYNIDQIKVFVAGDSWQILTINKKLKHSSKNGKHHFKYIDEAEIGHYRYIADINGFFNNLYQIIYGIKDTLKEKNEGSDQRSS